MTIPFFCEQCCCQRWRSRRWRNGTWWNEYNRKIKKYIFSVCFSIRPASLSTASHMQGVDVDRQEKMTCILVKYSLMRVFQPNFQNRKSHETTKTRI